MHRILALALVACLSLSADAAQKKNNAKNKGPSKAQAAKHLDAAKDRLRAAQTAARRAERELAAARDSASAKHLKASGLPQAQAVAKHAAAQLATIRRVITESVRQREDHIQASVAAKDAGEKLRQLNQQPKLSAERKRELRAKLSPIVRRPVEMERAAIAEDSRHARLAEEVRQANQSEANASAKYQRLLASDASIKNAMKTFHAAKSEFQDAEAEVTRKNRDYQAAIRAENQAKRQRTSKKKSKGNQKGGPKKRKQK